MPKEQEKGLDPNVRYRWAWRRLFPERYDQTCRVVEWTKLEGKVGVEFDSDGLRAAVPRMALRRVQP